MVCVCVCVCVCGIRPRVARVDVAFARASGVRIRIRATNPRRIDRSRARGGAIARAGSMASRAHHRCATGAQASVSRGRKMMRRSRAMGATRARARGGGRGARAAGGADGARRGGGGAWGGDRGDSCVASALSGKNGRGWTEKNVASADGKASTSKATGADGLGLGGGTARAKREGRRRRPGRARHLGVEGDEHGWRR